MTRSWRAWVELWNRREDAAALSLIRILVGLVLLYDFITIRHLDLVEALYAPAPAGYASSYDGWASSLFGRGPDAAFAMWLAATLLVVAITTGTLTRVACLAFVLLSAQLAHLAPDSDRGIDMILRIVIAILALSRCNARWSVDAWLMRLVGRPIPHAVPAWPRYLLLLQLVWIYFAGGINKGGPAWGPFEGFEALANILADPHLARFDPAWLAIALPLTRIATALTMLFELAAPLYLLLLYYAATPNHGGRLRTIAARLRLRWVWLALGLSFHLGIAITLRLGIFPWGMLALYPALLLPGELRRLTARKRLIPLAN